MSITIPSEFDHLRVLIGDLVPMEGNPNQGDVDAIAGSLAQFGQRVPIVYRNEPDPDDPQTLRKVVYAGNHRLAAANQLGWEEVAAVAADDLSHQQIRAFSLADNRTAELSERDPDLLMAALEALSDDDELLAATAYTMDAMLEELDSKAPPEGLLPGDLGEKTFTYKEQHAVTVVCDDEAHQQETYERLRDMGYDCKTVTV